MPKIWSAVGLLVLAAAAIGLAVVLSGAADDAEGASATTLDLLAFAFIAGAAGAAIVAVINLKSGLSGKAGD